MINDLWNNVRGRVHHRWLQNDYIVLLQARADALDETIREGKSIREDVLRQFVAWELNERDLVHMIDETVEALSPAQLLDEYPLNRMAEADKAWLKEVVHALYLARTGMEQRVAEIRTKMKRLSEMYAHLMSLIEGRTEMRPGEQPFRQFHQEILELSAMISSLPHEVQVV